MLPVDELVPLPVIGEVREVVVGELHGGRARRPHVVPPGHALILPSSTPTVCQVGCGAVGSGDSTDDRSGLGSFALFVVRGS